MPNQSFVYFIFKSSFAIDKDGRHQFKADIKPILGNDPDYDDYAGWKQCNDAWVFSLPYYQYHSWNKCINEFDYDQFKDILSHCTICYQDPETNLSGVVILEDDDIVHVLADDYYGFLNELFTDVFDVLKSKDCTKELLYKKFPGLEYWDDGCFPDDFMTNNV